MCKSAKSTVNEVENFRKLLETQTPSEALETIQNLQEIQSFLDAFGIKGVTFKVVGAVKTKH